MNTIKYLFFSICFILVGCKNIGNNVKVSTQISPLPSPSEVLINNSPLTFKSFMGANNPQVVLPLDSINLLLSIDNSGNLLYSNMQLTNYYVLQSSTDLSNWTNNIIFYNQTNYQVNFNKNKQFFRIRVIDATTVHLVYDLTNNNLIDHLMVYYGTNSLEYSNSFPIIVTNNTIVSNLSPNLTYYFALTSVDASNIESDFSNEVQYNKDNLLNILNNYTNIIGNVNNTNITQTNNTGTTNIVIINNNPPPNDPIITNGLVSFYKYNGSNSIFIDTNTPYILTEPAGTNDFSALAWIKTIKTSSDQMILSKFNPTNNQFYGITVGQNNGNVNFFVKGPFGSPSQVQSLTQGADDKWHHVSLICSNGNVITYVDSKFTGLIKYAQPVDIGNIPFIIGEYKTNGLIPFQGIVDNVSIYSRALSSNEISRVFNQN